MVKYLVFFMFICSHAFYGAANNTDLPPKTMKYLQSKYGLIKAAPKSGINRYYGTHQYYGEAINSCHAVGMSLPETQKVISKIMQSSKTPQEFYDNFQYFMQFDFLQKSDEDDDGA